jgi:hypothetical protein
MGPSFGQFETDDASHKRTRFLHAIMEDDETTTTITSSSSTTIGAVKFEKVATLLEWIKAYRKKASRKTSKKAMARKYLDRFFAAHYPQFFTRERTGMFPLYRLLAPQVRREREKEKLPLSPRRRRRSFALDFRRPRAVFCADGDILLSFSLWFYVRNSWTKNARRTI